MRAGLCTVPQALTSEAANIVKQAVHLARRRGHAQVTPLHVASAMLAFPNGLLRRACTRHSHSHPLQCKALELCFNVALNRLPASTSSPLLLGPHQSPRPSLSNALVAAFKRAQAHQRRGSIENQQHPILAIKIEVEQLVISILDDPSVSRVMREAGFSSSQVKSKVEEDVQLDVCSRSPDRSLDQVKISDDVMSVLNALVSKKRNTVIVGGCLASNEGVIRGLMDKFERGQAPGDLKYAQFISLPLLSLRNLSKEEVEQKLVELRCLVKSYVGRGIVLYLGDLKWVSEFWATYGEQKRNYYCVVEYIIMEIKRLVFEIGESERLWLMGIADFQTYMSCKAGHPSLENMWKLHSFTIPIGSLTLSLNLDSYSQTHFAKVQRDGFNWPLLESGAQSMASSIQKNESPAAAAKSTLPSWLQKYKEESRRNSNIIKDDQDLCQKWNSFGNKQIRYPEKVLHFSSSPSSFASASSQQCKQLPKEHQFWISEISDDEGYESSLRNNPKPDLLSAPNSSPNSASSSEVEEEDPDCLNSFKKLTNENLKILSDALESKVPWQKEIIPEIAITILKCRSGSSTQKQNKLKRQDVKEETWLLFIGADHQGKEMIAREIAKVVFGSQNSFSSIKLTNKRAREELDSSYIERFGMALNENPHRVFFMEDLEQVNYNCQKGLRQAIESGSIALPEGEIVPFKDSIIIFSCNSFGSLATACSPNKRLKSGDNAEKDGVSHSLDLNIAIEDIEGEDDHSVGDIRILESVDKQIIFKIQEL